MALGEFDLIGKFFLGEPVGNPILQGPRPLLGIGDDAALVRLDPDQDMAVAMATVHGPETGWGTHTMGWRALALALGQLSDLRARPAWFTLSLTIPHVREDWLSGFSRALKAFAGKRQVSLIGGDTTRGPLSVTIIANGYLTQAASKPSLMGGVDRGVRS